MKVAVSGKGGSGKSTIAGTLARAWGRQGRSVVAIDADPNPNLAITLGIPREDAATLAPIPSDLLEERIDPSGTRTLGFTMDLGELVKTYGVDAPDGVTLLVMGRVDHAGVG